MSEPALPEEITGKALGSAGWQELRTLSVEDAEVVAKHMVAAAAFLEDDEDLALAHANFAAARAGRVAVVREALGMVRYSRGEYAEALREFRTARRLSGTDHLLPYLVDCERGMGRYDRALDLAKTADDANLTEAERIELAIVVSGVRRDMGQPEAALVGLRIPALRRGTTQPWAARLFYAYAEALLATGAEQQSREWFAKALDADTEGQTDADERLNELDGIELIDLLDDAVEQDDDAAEQDAGDSGSEQDDAAGQDGEAGDFDASSR